MSDISLLLYDVSLVIILKHNVLRKVLFATNTALKPSDQLTMVLRDE